MSRHDIHAWKCDRPSAFRHGRASVGDFGIAHAAHWVRPRADRDRIAAAELASERTRRTARRLTSEP